MPERNALMDELGQKRPFTSLSQEATIALLRTADIVRRRIAAVCEGHDLTLQQFNVLRILRGNGAPLPTLEIAERMVEHAPGITRLVDRLEVKGYVARVRDSTDRRRMFCSITDTGLALLTALDPAVREADRTAIGPLSSQRLHDLIAILEEVRTAKG